MKLALGLGLIFVPIVWVVAVIYLAATGYTLAALCLTLGPIVWPVGQGVLMAFVEVFGGDA